MCACFFKIDTHLNKSMFVFCGVFFGGGGLGLGYFSFTVLFDQIVQTSKSYHKRESENSTLPAKYEERKIERK